MSEHELGSIVTETKFVIDAIREAFTSLRKKLARISSLVEYIEILAQLTDKLAILWDDKIKPKLIEWQEQRKALQAAENTVRMQAHLITTLNEKLEAQDNPAEAPAFEIVSDIIQRWPKTRMSSFLFADDKPRTHSGIRLSAILNKRK